MPSQTICDKGAIKYQLNQSCQGGGGFYALFLRFSYERKICELENYFNKERVTQLEDLMQQRRVALTSGFSRMHQSRDTQLIKTELLFCVRSLFLAVCCSCV